MRKRVVVLSGCIASGKTSVAEIIAQRFGFISLTTRDLLERRPEFRGERPNRQQLQALGSQLDNETGGRWVLDGLVQFINDNPDAPGYILDSVRVQEQIDIIRQHLKREVTHVHLTAPVSVLEKRYQERARTKGDGDPGGSYFAAKFNATEQQVENLKDTADAVIDTHWNTVQDVVVRVAACIGLQSRNDSKLVDVLIGGQYGSEGKGQICSYLAPEYDLLVRVGGPNAGHKVFAEPAPYTFHILPSGTRSCSARLILGPGATVGLSRLLQEIKDCDVSPKRLTIDGQAMIISDEDRAAEATLRSKIGSTAQGVGAATARRIMGRSDPPKLARDIEELKPFVGDTLEVLEDMYRDGKRILLEGTQGTGLSLYHGHYPHVTSRDTSVAGTLSEAGIAPARVNRVVMVLRAYPIRVADPVDGTSGPMNREISWDEISQRSHIPLEQLQTAERTSTTGRGRRVSEFDWAQLRRSCLLNCPTDLALTFVDYLGAGNGTARRFEQLSSDTVRFVDELERCAQAPVALISNGFGHHSIIDRRTWRSMTA